MYDFDVYGEWGGAIDPGSADLADLEQVLGIFGAVFLAALAVGLLVGLVLYIFESLGLYRMAGKCRMRYPGLVFIPFVNLYYLGRLAQRGAVAYGKKALPFHVLLPLGGALMALLGGGLATAVTVVGARWIIGFGYRYVDEDAMLGFFGIVLVVSALLVLIALATAVFEYMALYQVYRLFVPENAAVYLVLSILVPVTMPFFLFAAGGREPGGCPASPVAPVPTPAVPQAPATPPQPPMNEG